MEEGGGDGAQRRPVLAVLWFWLVAAIVLAVSTTLTLWDARARQITAAERNLEALSRILSEQTTRTFQSIDLILQSAAERLVHEYPPDTPPLAADVNALLGARISGATQIRSLFVVGLDGRVRYSALASPIGIPVEDRDYVAAHRERRSTGLFIGAPVQNRVDGEWSIFVSRRLADADGAYAGVVAASVPLSYFNALYQSVKPLEGSAIALFRRDGTLLYGEPPFGEDLAAGWSAAEGEPWAGLASALRQSVVRVAGTVPRIVATGAVEGFPLVTMIALSEHSALEAWRDQAALIVAGLVGVILLLGVAAWAFARELVREESLAQSLRESEARLQGIISTAMDAIVTMDGSGRIVLFNPAAERMFGCSVENAMGSRLDRFIPERYRGAHRDHVSRFGHSGQMARTKENRSEIVALRADGEEVVVDASISQVDASGRKLYTAVLRDITTRLEREEALRRSNRQLRELSAALESIREEERTRIARELHDDLGQQLTGLRMNLSWVRSRLRVDQTELLDKVSGLQKQIDMTIGSVRRITAELRPLMLDDLGLFAAVNWLVEDVAKKTGLEIDLLLDEIEPELDDETASALFRILQESLTNVARHAEASSVQVSLARSGERLVLTVVDDGRGMELADQSKPRSFGLIGIRERAYILGGSVSIVSEPGQGFAIEVEVPVPASSPIAEEHRT